MFGLFNKKSRNSTAPAAGSAATDELSPETIDLVNQAGKFFANEVQRQKALRDLGLPYDIANDGTLTIRGSVDLSGRGLDDLPDMSGMIVDGDFTCAGNNLASLKGAPREVRGTFDCSNNELTTLEHGPELVKGDYRCAGNRLPAPDPLGEPPAALRAELAQFAQDAAAQEAVTLGKPLSVSRPLTFKPRS